MILRKYFSELLEDGSQNVQMHTLINPWRTKSQLAAYAYIAEQYGYRYMGLAPYSSSGRSFPIFGFRRLPDAEERARRTQEQYPHPLPNGPFPGMLEGATASLLALTSGRRWTSCTRGSRWTSSAESARSASGAWLSPYPSASSLPSCSEGLLRPRRWSQVASRWPTSSTCARYEFPCAASWPSTSGCFRRQASPGRQPIADTLHPPDSEATGEHRSSKSAHRPDQGARVRPPPRPLLATGSSARLPY